MKLDDALQGVSRLAFDTALIKWSAVAASARSPRRARAGLGGFRSNAPLPILKSSSFQS